MPELSTNVDKLSTSQQFLKAWYATEGAYYDFQDLPAEADPAKVTRTKKRLVKCAEKFRDVYKTVEGKKGVIIGNWTVMIDENGVVTQLDRAIFEEVEKLLEKASNLLADFGTMKAKFNIKMKREEDIQVTRAEKKTTEELAKFIAQLDAEFERQRKREEEDFDAEFDFVEEPVYLTIPEFEKLTDDEDNYVYLTIPVTAEQLGGNLSGDQAGSDDGIRSDEDIFGFSNYADGAVLSALGSVLSTASSVLSTAASVTATASKVARSAADAVSDMFNLCSAASTLNGI